jgi:hypothetical protein
MNLRSACIAVACLPPVSIGGAAQANQRTDLRPALKRIYEPSTVEVQSKALEGRRARRGAVLPLETDGVPAKPFRVTQVNTKSPRFHVHDYARVEIINGTRRGRDGDLTLPKGTRVVVLDRKVRSDAVHLFTHTAEPMREAGRTPVYGCTEFVFPVKAAEVDRTDAAGVRRVIERVLRPVERS